MSQGVPGTPPAQVLQDAIGDAASSAASFGYAPGDGEPLMKKALAEEMKVIYGSGADVTPDDIALTTGSNMAFMATIMTLAGTGDEVILPTGATYSPALIASFLELATKHDIALIVDETYRDFILTGAPHSIFSGAWRSNFIHLFSFSKSYCLPGHRLGAIAGSPLFLTHVRTVLDCLQICAPRPFQIALTPLLPTLRPAIRKNAIAIQARHELFRRVLPSPWKIGAQGGYFAYVKHPFRGVTAFEVSKRLAIELGVITLPSAFFGEDGKGGGDQAESDKTRWIRFSVANVDDEKVVQICERLGEAESLFQEWNVDNN
ncbi:hypothetical protein DXG03_009114 [Asterophora parasitica]|uniref:Aminotransferase class I/classII large domain-containing protein n=1 Tax=Asterophora parasitica TaxID=117018 RepID=A0A9P7GB78_9AGAR|nr:hypothetical protein DXG03_009114 [Asterophora parasitica]